MRIQLDKTDAAIAQMVAEPDTPYPPSVRDICAELKIGPSSVQRRIDRLVAKGVLDRAPHIARSLRLADGVTLEPGEAVVPE